MSNRRKITVVSLVAFPIIAIAIFIWLPDGPVEIVVSPATTYLTEPLTADGRVDYAEALNRHYGRGATPLNNAAIPLWKLAHETTDDRFVREYFAKLGTAPPATSEPEFVPLLSPTENSDLLNETLAQSVLRPWRTDEYPKVAVWLNDNESQLAKAVAASRLPVYYSPIVHDPDEILSMIQLPGVRGIRTLAQALVARSMQHLHYQRFSEAWGDLTAALRLGRLAANGSTLVEGLVSCSIEKVTLQGFRQYLLLAPLSRDSSLSCRLELKSIPAAERIADKIKLCERFMQLDVLIRLARKDVHAFEGSFFEKLANGPTRNLDFHAATLQCNADWDRIAAIMTNPDPRIASLEWYALESELDVLPVNPHKPVHIWHNFFARNYVAKVRGETFSRMLLKAEVPAIRAVIHVARTARQEFDLLLLGFRLAAFHAQHGKYPAALAELEMHDGEPLPIDRFTSNDLAYRTANGGYLLYSFGPNGEDNGGRTREDTSDGGDDDIPLRIERHKTN